MFCFLVKNQNNPLIENYATQQLRKLLLRINKHKTYTVVLVSVEFNFKDRLQSVTQLPPCSARAAIFRSCLFFYFINWLSDNIVLYTFEDTNQKVSENCPPIIMLFVNIYHHDEYFFNIHY